MTFLDTNIISYYLNADKQIINNIMQLVDDNEILCTTVVNKFEIIRGFKWKKSKKKENMARGFMSKLMLFSIDNDVIEIAAEIYSDLRKKGLNIEDADILIAAIVIRYEGTLVTNNIKHFENIEQLKVVNWV